MTDHANTGKTTSQIDGFSSGTEMLQAIGPHLEDHTSMQFTALLAQAFGGFHRPPGYE